MSVIDAFLMNHELIEKGFKGLLGINKYILAKDKDDNLICFLYDMDACKPVIEKYLKEQNIDKAKVKFESHSIKNKGEQLDYIMPYKLVVLDGKLTLYKEVEEKAKDHEIKGYTGKRPKYGINKYETMQ